MSQELITQVAILVVIHVFVIELFIWIARHSLWIIPAFFASVVAFFMVMILLKTPSITANEIISLNGTYDYYAINKDNWYVIHLENDPHEYLIPDIKYFNQTAFVRKVEPGDNLTVFFTQNALKSNSHRVILFGLQSQTETFLQVNDVLADRYFGRNVIAPIVLIISIFVIIASLYAFIVRRESLDVNLGILVGACVLFVLEFYFRYGEKQL